MKPRLELAFHLFRSWEYSSTLDRSETLRVGRSSNCVLNRDRIWDHDGALPFGNFSSSGVKSQRDRAVHSVSVKKSKLRYRDGKKLIGTSSSLLCESLPYCGHISRSKDVLHSSALRDRGISRRLEKKQSLEVANLIHSGGRVGCFLDCKEVALACYSLSRPKPGNSVYRSFRSQLRHLMRDPEYRAGVYTRFVGRSGTFNSAKNRCKVYARRLKRKVVKGLESFHLPDHLLNRPVPQRDKFKKSTMMTMFRWRLGSHSSLRLFPLSTCPTIKEHLARHQRGFHWTCQGPAKSRSGFVKLL